MPASVDDASLFGGRMVLAVFAHPDDESLACGGTLARLAAAGARVVLACASRGERGSLAGPVRDDALGSIRAGEMRRAAEALGVSRLILLDHPDGDLRWSHVSELHAQILLLLGHEECAAVITFGDDGLYWHADHIAVHERTTSALRTLGANAPPLYYVTMPQGTMRAIVDGARARGWTPPANGFWSLTPDAFGLAAKPPTAMVDVSAWVPQKLDAIRCHRTQVGADDPFGQLSDSEARRWLGTEYFHRAAIGGRQETVLESLCASKH